jgi:DNA-binding IclR family transcriptional regulator
MEIARFLGINKSTARRVMRSLIYMDYVRQDPESGKYYLTERLLRIAKRRPD